MSGSMVLTSRIRGRVRVNGTYISDMYSCQSQRYLQLGYVTGSESMVLTSWIRVRARVNGTYISDT